MSEKKPQGKPSFFDRVKAWFIKLPQAIATPFKNMVSELKKVSWPTRKELINYTVVVVAFMLFMTVVVGLLDYGASALMQTLIRL